MADYLATYETPGTGAVMQVEVNFAGQRPDLPNDPAPYLDAANVKAQIVTEATSTTLEVVQDITITLVNSTTFRTDVVVPLGTVLRVYRITDIEFPIVDFVSLQVVSEADLDLQARQTLYAVMESRDAATRAQVYANFAQSVSVEANASAKDAVEKAEAAVATADAAQAAAAQAVQTANAASQKSDEALAAAAAAEEHASNVETLAQSAQDAAAAAQQEATDAHAAADNAVSIANGIDGKADAALAAAQRADTNAAQALEVANGIAATAQAARDTANQANAAAQAAVQTANAVDAKAQQALDTAAQANTAAGNAVTAANAAVQSATTANSGVTAVNQRVDVLANRVTALETWKAYADNVLNNHEFRITSNTNRLTALDTRVDAVNAALTTARPTFPATCLNNALFVLHKGVLYATVGSTANVENPGTGRAPSGALSASEFGINNMSPVPVPTSLAITQAGGFGGSYYALDTGGNLFMWGMNSSGECGVGSQNAVIVPTLVQTDVLNVYSSASAASGIYRNMPTAVIQKADGIYTAGCAESGRAGNGATSGVLTSFTRVLEVAASTVIGVFNLGTRYGCVFVVTTAAVWVWGYNAFGQLGLGSTANVLTPTNAGTWAPGGNSPKKMYIAQGYSNASTTDAGTTVLALLYDGRVMACGYGAYGLLGNGGTANTNVPAVLPLTTVTDLVVQGDGPGSAFALQPSGRIAYWGYNSGGQLGDGTTTQRNTPLYHPVLTTVDKILSQGQASPAFGYFTTTYFRMRELPDGSKPIYGLGIAGTGSRGDGQTGAQRLSPTRVLFPYRDGAAQRPLEIVDITVSMTSWGDSGAFTQLAVDSAGNLWGWGYNAHGLVMSPPGSAVWSPVRFNSPWTRGEL